MFIKRNNMNDKHQQLVHQTLEAIDAQINGVKYDAAEYDVSLGRQ